MPTNPTSPSLQLGAAAITRGEKALYDNWSAGDGETTTREDVVVAVSAALRLDDPETLDRFARHLYELAATSGWTLNNDWPAESDGHKEVWRGIARAAISALLADPEEAEGG